MKAQSDELIRETLTLELEEGLHLLESVSWLSGICAVIDDDVGVVGTVGFVDDDAVLHVLEDWLLHATREERALVSHWGLALSVQGVVLSALAAAAKSLRSLLQESVSLFVTQILALDCVIVDISKGEVSILSPAVSLEGYSKDEKRDVEESKSSVDVAIHLVVSFTMMVAVTTTFIPISISLLPFWRFLHLREEAVIVLTGLSQMSRATISFAGEHTWCDLLLGTQVRKNAFNLLASWLVVMNVKVSVFLPSRRVRVFGLVNFARACGHFVEFSWAKIDKL